MPAAHAALLEGGVAETVIGGALVAVLEHVIGLVEFLELVLALVVARIAIRMMLHGELAEGGLQLDLGAGARNAQDFVVVAFGHSAALAADSECARRSHGTARSPPPLRGRDRAGGSSQQQR